MVRDLKNRSKLDPLLKAYGEENYYKVQFVEADLSNNDSLIKAIAGCHYIIHIANPVPGAKGLTDLQLVQPVVESMKTILEAAVANKVKKMIVTSSMATMQSLGGSVKDSFSEEDYATLDGVDGYGKGKII